MKPSKALTINKHEAQLRVYGEVQLRVYGAKYKGSVVANYAERGFKASTKTMCLIHHKIFTYTVIDNCTIQTFFVS